MNRMSQNNRAHRADKKRQRESQRRRAQSSARPSSSFPWAPSGAERAAAALVEAAMRQQLGGPVVAEQLSTVERMWNQTPDEVGRILDDLLMRTAERLFATGWTPVDFHEVGRRRLTGRAASCLDDIVVAATASYPSAQVDALWSAELEGIGGAVWWDPADSLVAQWARASHTVTDVFALIVDMLALMFSLEDLAPTLSPPGSGLTSVQHEDLMDSAMLAKVRALLAKAESTEFDEEAEALSAKAQELMTRCAIDHAMLGRAPRRQRAALRRMWLAAPYVRAKATLVAAVAEANRCRTVLAEETGYVTVIGDQGDVRVVVLLATSLQVQANRALAAAGSQYARSGISRSRSFRHSFLIAYAQRIGERLQETAEVVLAEADRSRLVPVFAARTRAVDESLEHHFPTLVQRRVTSTNALGRATGRAAADLALFDVATMLAGPADLVGERTG